jgi:hypothetical protein
LDAPSPVETRFIASLRKWTEVIVIPPGGRLCTFWKLIFEEKPEGFKATLQEKKRATLTVRLLPFRFLLVILDPTFPFE